MLPLTGDQPLVVLWLGSLRGILLFGILWSIWLLAILAVVAGILLLSVVYRRALQMELQEQLNNESKIWSG